LIGAVVRATPLCSSTFDKHPLMKFTLKKRVQGGTCECTLTQDESDAPDDPDGSDIRRRACNLIHKLFDDLSHSAVNTELFHHVFDQHLDYYNGGWSMEDWWISLK